MKRIKIGKRFIGRSEPTYVIAEIGSNFDRSLDRAKMLIDLAKECGCDAAKFQCFSADKIVSKEGFDGMKSAFQAKWKKPVYEVYKDAEFPRQWHDELFKYSRKVGIDFFSSAYDFEAADILDDLGVDVFKIGSGDITWLEYLRYVARKKKPIIIGAGASTLAEVDEALRVMREEGNNDIVLLQCVTNYPNKFESANIRAMKAMGEMFNVLTGYSDHTPGSVVALGAVALGGCVIEKHFTDDKKRQGPDHPFAMDAKDMKEMVESIRKLEKALGSPVKDLYEEESTTVVLQRRCLRAAKTLPKGTKLKKDMISVLRPAPLKALAPKYKDVLVGRELKENMQKGDIFTWETVC